ncbi:MAG: indolepyruvate ferredoxin oxidoreductase family protein, partial [Burkholderiaceae bacterium]|nr:indolepyruvate ferredoxin oxidoreductase family protein [Burkholderiaceae bacterium]
YYFKLMAGKDEYEVARLHSNGDFLARIADQFEGDYTLRYNLAPPLFARTGADGLPVKSEYGSWVRHVFSLLAKFRFLRGTMFDIFAYTEERKAERALADEYRTLVESLLPRMTAANLPTIIAIASIPEDIRGYSHVRQHHLAAARKKEAKLLAELDRRQP